MMVAADEDVLDSLRLEHDAKEMVIRAGDSNGPDWDGVNAFHSNPYGARFWI